MAEKRNAKAVLVDDIEQSATPGQYHLFEQYGKPGIVAGMLFVCPCGCGDVSSVHFTTAQIKPPVWTWNGNRERPTLTPSLLKTIGCKWHGFLTDGEFREC